MKKQLVNAGNSWQLYINKSIIKLLGINDKEHKVRIDIDNKVLKVQKISNADAKKFNDDLLIKKLIKRSSSYGLTLTTSLIKLMDINPELDMVKLEVWNGILTLCKS